MALENRGFSAKLGNIASKRRGYLGAFRTTAKSRHCRLTGRGRLWGQIQTPAPQQTTKLFDHFVGADRQNMRDCDRVELTRAKREFPEGNLRMGGRAP